MLDRTRDSVCEVAKLLPDPPVEVRAGQLRQAANVLAEADGQLLPATQLAHRLAVQVDIHGVPAGRVGDVKDVIRRHDERSRRKRVWRDETHHVALYAPGQDGSLVREVVSGGSRRGRR